jgi:hypothetical protein
MKRTNFSDYVSRQIEERTSESGRRIRTTARTMRSVAEQLRHDPNTAMASDLAERGADAIDRVGAYLQVTPIDKMLADADELGRRRPWIVVTAGLAAGVVASRLLKSTASRRTRVVTGEIS